MRIDSKRHFGALMQICFTVASLQALKRSESLYEIPAFGDPYRQDLLHRCLIWQEKRGRGAQDA